MMLSIRPATATDTPEIERMVVDSVKGHPAENHVRTSGELVKAYFGAHPVAHLLVAERDRDIVGMAQWRLIYDMFWGMFGAEAGWLYVKPACRGSGIVAALVARVCAEIVMRPIGYVRGGRLEATKDHWGDNRCRLELDKKRFPPDALMGFDEISHVEVNGARCSPAAWPSGLAVGRNLRSAWSNATQPNRRFDLSRARIGRHGGGCRRSGCRRWHADPRPQTRLVGLLRVRAVGPPLRAQPEIAEEYSDFKCRLASRHPWDIAAYMDGKDPFVKATERAALAWWPSCRRRDPRGQDDLDPE
jgi:GNAT superfamily N-acetyltransferase